MESYTIQRLNSRGKSLVLLVIQDCCPIQTRVRNSSNVKVAGHSSWIVDLVQLSIRRSLSAIGRTMYLVATKVYIITRHTSPILILYRQYIDITPIFYRYIDYTTIDTVRSSYPHVVCSQVDAVEKVVSSHLTYDNYLLFSPIKLCIHVTRVFTISATPFFTSGQHWSSNSDHERSSISNLLSQIPIIRCYIGSDTEISLY